MFDAEHLLHVSFKSLVQTQSARRALSTAERVHETVMAVTVQGCAAPRPPCGLARPRPRRPPSPRSIDRPPRCHLPLPLTPLGRRPQPADPDASPPFSSDAILESHARRLTQSLRRLSRGERSRRDLPLISP